MSGFSPEWLALREPVDHRARERRLAARLAGYFAGRPRITVVDLGCGTGSNLRGSFALLPVTQDWTLVDYDPRLLAAARQRLSTWGDTSEPQGDALAIAKGGKQMTVRFRQADLNAGLETALGDTPDLVTASALFDLCSAEFIAGFAGAVARRRAAFYTVLSYNGVQSWTPAHASDAAMTAAFHAHQRSDKGFGASLGPGAPEALARAFQANGYEVGEGDSPWVLGASEQRLISELADGFAGAAGETGTVPVDEIRVWRSIQRSSAAVGHTDTLALPAR